MLRTIHFRKFYIHESYKSVLNTIFRKGHRVVLHFRNRKGGKYRGAFLLAENDDLASKHELAHGVKRKRSD